MKHETLFTKDFANKKLNVTREFSAPVEKVWKAWTESELLDKWWAPKPWKTETVSMDFSEGGHWLYYMAGAGGEKHYSKVNFETIIPGRQFTAANIFCDEHGEPVGNMSVGHWKNTFKATPTGSKVEVELSFDNEDSLKNMIAMGFEKGFTMGLGNLEELLEAEKVKI
jgi:uncharacterized protein YndB with AHSA1/START domain